jgi:hypothetical protein
MRGGFEVMSEVTVGNKAVQITGPPEELRPQWPGGVIFALIAEGFQSFSDTTAEGFRL